MEPNPNTNTNTNPNSSLKIMVKTTILNTVNKENKTCYFGADKIKSMSMTMRMSMISVRLTYAQPIST